MGEEGIPKKQLDIVITYRNKPYKYFWVKQTRSGIFYGFHFKKTPAFHVSYHVDGKRHTTIEKKRETPRDVHVFSHNSIPFSKIKNKYGKS